MAKVKYCMDCKRNVTPRKKFNWLPVIFVIGIPFYLPYYLFIKRKKCPICTGTQFSKPQYS
jgi:RNA polymerase subunit RPABC4/transcription elongation factor Spt4